MSGQVEYKITIAMLTPTAERYPAEKKLYEQIVKAIDVGSISALVNKTESAYLQQPPAEGEPNKE